MSQNEYHILLLPRENYFAWVEAAKPYAARYGLVLTADPDHAGRYMAPLQTVTIAVTSDGYPNQGDIRAWFYRSYPQARLDLIWCATPAELAAALQTRLEANQRFVSPSGFKLRWPTDYARVEQPFGVNPEVYRRWGLPGHEGVDILAPSQTPIYAGAEGTVSRVDRFNGDAEAMPYGNSVRLQHADGYETVYAYLAEVGVQVGQTVQAGAVIGRAGATGNSAGDRLHLTLKKAGATEAGLTHFPRDIVDPTPYLEWPAGVVTTPGEFSTLWPAAHCLAGVHGRADGRLQNADYAPMHTARMEAVKLLTTAGPEDVDRLRAEFPRMFIMMRLFAHFDGRVVTPAEFAQWSLDAMPAFYQRGVRYFEIHNEPNLRLEGWQQSWQNGGEFGAWFLDVRSRLKQAFPQALFGYPGLSPGDDVPGIRQNALQFLTASDAACRAADWVGLHCYWISEPEFNSAAGGLGYLEYRRRFADKLLFITEFSNVEPNTPKSVKGEQYARYYQHLRSVPGIGAAFSFVLSASSGFAHETWRNEDGSVTPIPALVGARRDTVSPPPPPPG